MDKQTGQLGKIVPESSNQDAYEVSLATLKEIWPTPQQTLVKGTDVWPNLNQQTKDLWQGEANNGKRNLGTINALIFKGYGSNYL